MPNPMIPQGQNKWWVSHVECNTGWFAGPFNTQQEAEIYRDSLISPDSCPGCGTATPDRSNYDISQM